MRCRNPPRRLLGFKVVYVDRIGDGNYGGMNCLAARDLGIPFPHKCSVVVIDRNQSCKAIRDTIRHEAIEVEILKATGTTYKKAHKLTTEIEKVTK